MPLSWNDVRFCERVPVCDCSIFCWVYFVSFREADTCKPIITLSHIKLFQTIQFVYSHDKIVYNLKAIHFWHENIIFYSFIFSHSKPICFICFFRWKKNYFCSEHLYWVIQISISLQIVSNIGLKIESQKHCTAWRVKTYIVLIFCQVVFHPFRLKWKAFDLNRNESDIHLMIAKIPWEKRLQTSQMKQWIAIRKGILWHTNKELMIVCCANLKFWNTMEVLR